MELPSILLLDLDDTIVTFEEHGPPAWREVCQEAARRCGVGAETLYAELGRVADDYWANPEHHRIGRLDLDNTRRRLACEAFANLGVEAALAIATTDAYIALREAKMGLFPGVREALAILSTRHTLALVTNGESHKQRGKIERFALAPFFARVFVEEEVGVGKPDPAVYRHVLGVIGAAPVDCCMIGDNLAWDVAAPQSLGIRGVWNDWRGQGLPQGTAVVPDRIIGSIAELAA
jgi:putative hydrolase of the HAD superfamily